MLKPVVWIFFVIMVASMLLFFSNFLREPLKKEIAHAKQHASSVQASRAKEQKIIKNDVAISKTYQDGINDGKKDLDTAIAKLRAERVRNRATASSGMPNNSTPACRCNDEEGASISEEVARIGAEADDVTRQLTAAQELLGNRK